MFPNQDKYFLYTLTFHFHPAAPGDVVAEVEITILPNRHVKFITHTEMSEDFLLMVMAGVDRYVGLILDGALDVEEIPFDLDD